MTSQDTAIRYFTQAIRENWGTPAFSDFHGDTYRYCDVARKIAKLHILFFRGRHKARRQDRVLRPQLLAMGYGRPGNDHIRSCGCAYTS